MAAEGAAEATVACLTAGGSMKLRHWIFGLIILTQFASSGCMLFGRRNNCCGERKGLFGFLHKHRNVENGIAMPGGMECGTGCSSCGGDFPGMAVSGGPMFVPPGGLPDERLGAPAVNRAWEGQGPPPAPMPKTNSGSR